MLRITSKGLKELVARYQDAEPITRRAFLDELQKLGHFARELCKDEVRDVRYTGALESSFEVREYHSDLSVDIKPKAPHSIYVRMGTRPHWAPIGPLKAWAAAKLGDAQLGYAVQRGIAEQGTSVFQQRKRGTKANPWPERVVERGDFQNALKNTTRTIGETIIAKI
jgi:hypothetical protein